MPATDSWGGSMGPGSASGTGGPGSLGGIDPGRKYGGDQGMPFGLGPDSFDWQGVIDDLYNKKPGWFSPPRAPTWDVERRIQYDVSGSYLGFNGGAVAAASQGGASGRNGARGQDRIRSWFQSGRR